MTPTRDVRRCVREEGIQKPEFLTRLNLDICLDPKLVSAKQFRINGPDNILNE